MATARNSFEYTATGILGDQRRSMLKNELHFRVKAAYHCVRSNLHNVLVFV